MTRVAVIVVASLALTGCSSFSVGDWMPSMSGGGSIPLRIESDPPGADARTSSGQSCRTPCTITVPAASGLTVAFGLAGYESQTVPVDLVPGSTGADFTPPQLSPNPVVAALQPAAPPPAAKKKSKPKPRTAGPAAERSAPAPAATGSTRSSAPASSDPPASQRSIPGSAPTAPPASAWPPPR